MCILYILRFKWCLYRLVYICFAAPKCMTIKNLAQKNITTGFLDICVLSANLFGSWGWYALLFTQTIHFNYLTQHSMWHILNYSYCCCCSLRSFVTSWILRSPIEIVAHFVPIGSMTLSNSFQISWHSQCSCACPFSSSISMSFTFQLLVASCHLFLQTKKDVFNLLNDNTHYWQFTSYYPEKRAAYVQCARCSMTDKMYAHFEILLCDDFHGGQVCSAKKKRNYKMLSKNAVYAKR